MSEQHAVRAIAVSLIGAALLLASQASQATLVVDTTSGPLAGDTFVNFDNLPLGSAGGVSSGVSVSFNGDGGVVSGSAGTYAAPYVYGGNGAPFGVADGPDTSRYLASGIGSFTLSLPGSENYLGLLWGSIDTYNTLQFFNGSTLVGTLTGSDIISGNFGDQGVNGTRYVDIFSSLSFNAVVATSSSYAFEVDNVSFAAVPEPTASALLAAGIVALAFMVRRRPRG